MQNKEGDSLRAYENTILKDVIQKVGENGHLNPFMRKNETISTTSEVSSPKNSMFYREPDPMTKVQQYLKIGKT